MTFRLSGRCAITSRGTDARRPGQTGDWAPGPNGGVLSSGQISMPWIFGREALAESREGSLQPPVFQPFRDHHKGKRTTTAGEATRLAACQGDIRIDQ